MSLHRLHATALQNTYSEFINLVNSSIVKQTMLNISITERHSKAKDHEDLKRITGRYIELKSGLKFQLHYRYKTNDQVKNYALSDAASTIDTLLTTGFKTAVVWTSQATYKYYSKAGSGVIDGSYKKSMLKSIIPVQQANLKHDREKNNFIDINEPFLSALRITTTEASPQSLTDTYTWSCTYTHIHTQTHTHIPTHTFAPTSISTEKWQSRQCSSSSWYVRQT